jgi:hypothetical protein
VEDPEDDEPNAGAAYTFERTASGWPENEDQILRASNTEGGTDFTANEFGASVAISGDRVIVGVPEEDGGPSNSKDAAGAAYVFELSIAASASAIVDSDGVISFGGVGTELDFSGVSGSSEVTVKQYEEGPSTTDGISGSNVSNTHVTITSDLSFSSAEVRLSVNAFDGVSDPSNLTIYKRSEGASSFTALTPTNVGQNANGEEVVFASTDSFSEFVVVSDTEPLPVELASFEGTNTENGVRLTWQTASETNNTGFRVQRRVADENASESLRTSEGKWEQVGRVAGAGTTTEAQSYRFEDSELPHEADRLTYRLKQVDTDGTTSFSDEVTIERGVVKELQLQST